MPRVAAIRRLIVVACFLAALLMYLDRVCVSTIDRLIRDDLGLADAEMDWFKGIFFLAYALGQVPSGWLADRFGARTMMTVYVIVWSLLMAAMGWAQSFWALLLARAGYGLAQAGGYPTAASLVGRWAPVESRGAASAFVSFGGRLGGVLAPVLTAALVVMLLPDQWSPDFVNDDLRNADALRQSLVAAGRAAELEAASPAEANRPVNWNQALASRVWEAAAPAFRTRPLDPQTPSPADRDELVALLNHCLHDPELAEVAHVAQAPLPRAAQRILERPAGERSAVDAARLNRLVLETAFPTSLRSSYRSAWRPVMWLYGAFGLVVGGLFWFVARESPDLHPWCQAEAAPIASGANEVDRECAAPPDQLRAVRRREAIPWAALVGSPSLWMISLSQFGTNIGWAFVITSFPRFLDERFHVPFTDASKMQSLVLLVGIAGTLLGGTLTDALVRRAGVFWGRMLPMSVTRLVCSAACAACLACDSPWGVTAALAAMAFFTDLGMAAIWGFSQDVGGRHVGSVLGWGNMWGNLGAFLSPLAIGGSVQAFGWSSAFWICSLAFLTAGLSGLFVDARRSIFSAPPVGAAAAN